MPKWRKGGGQKDNECWNCGSTGVTHCTVVCVPPFCSLPTALCLFVVLVVILSFDILVFSRPVILSLCHSVCVSLSLSVSLSVSLCLSVSLFLYCAAGLHLPFHPFILPLPQPWVLRTRTAGLPETRLPVPPHRLLGVPPTRPHAEAVPHCGVVCGQDGQKVVQSPVFQLRVFQPHPLPVSQAPARR